MGNRGRGLGESTFLAGCRRTGFISWDNVTLDIQNAVQMKGIIKGRADTLLSYVVWMYGEGKLYDVVWPAGGSLDVYMTTFGILCANVTGLGDWP